MQWKGYLPYEASWEPEEGILPRCEELLNRPSPDVAIIPENVFFQGDCRTALEIAVTFACKVLFFGNVFRFFFAGKGVSRERRKFFEKDDFSAVYFPLG